MDSPLRREMTQDDRQRCPATNGALTIASTAAGKKFASKGFRGNLRYFHVTLEAIGHLEIGPSDLL